MAINEGVNLVSSSSSRSIPLGSISFYSIKTILKNILVSELSLMYIKISENIFSYQFDYNFFFSQKLSIILTWYTAVKGTLARIRATRAAVNSTFTIEMCPCSTLHNQSLFSHICRA